MKVSYFETGRYRAPADIPAIWPMPAAAYDTSEGVRVFGGMLERIAFAEKLGFDWVSLSEHHYSPRILTPSPAIVSSIASSSAMRTGLLCETIGPSSAILIVWTRAAP